MASTPEKIEIARSFLKDSETEVALKGLFDYVEARAQEQIRWYWRKKVWKARMSWSLRFVVIVLSTLGALVPIIKATFPPITTSYDFGQAGYLLIALAAGCVGLDRFFGYSSGWIRYVTTAMAIEKALEEYRMEWTRMTAKSGEHPPDADLVDGLIQLSKAFTLSVKVLVEQETKAWATEFQSNLAQLEADLKARADATQRAAKTQAEASRPGAISLTVDNGDQTDGGFSVSLDNKVVEESVLGSKCEILSVTPGLHRLGVGGTIGKQPALASEIVTVERGAILKVSLSLVKAKQSP